MIRITITSKHPVTIIADDERQYHPAWAVGASADRAELQLRGPMPRPHELRVTGMIVETFGQLNTKRFGTVSIEIDCENVSRPDEHLLLVRAIAAHALQLIVTPLLPK